MNDETRTWLRSLLGSPPEEASNAPHAGDDNAEMREFAAHLFTTTDPDDNPFQHRS